MDGITEKDCSPLWTMYQQIIADMKNATPMWEEFVSKATKLHSALKSALTAIAAFLDAFQKIADAATNARGATKDIGTALTRVCLRHRAIETRMKTFLGALMDTLVTPLADRAEEWRRGGSCTGALSREHARDCKRARAEVKRRVAEVARTGRKKRTDGKKRPDVCVQDIQERKQQLEEMEEKAVKAALIEERSRFCHFVTLLNPVVECEVAMLAEVGHLQEGCEQLTRYTAEPRTLPPASLQLTRYPAEPRTLPPASLQVISDTKHRSWTETMSAPHSPVTLGSRHSSLTSICSLASQGSDQRVVSGSTVSCSTPISNASSIGTLPQQTDMQKRLASVCSSDSGFRSQDALHRQLSLYADNGSDNQSVSSECNPSKGNGEDNRSDTTDLGNTASSTWPDLNDTAQFERAASAIMSGRPHTISAAYERGHPRAALSVHTFSSELDVCPRENIYARPPLPMRCSSLERPTVPAKTNCNSPQTDLKVAKPTSLPPHLTKEMPQALYVNMSELATLAASRAQQQLQQHSEHPQQEKVCSESSASESSLESSSGYGSQGAFAAEDQALQQQLQHGEVDSEIVTLRHSSDVTLSARDSYSVSLGSLEEAVRALEETSETPAFATVKKPQVPKRRPLSLAGGTWARRGPNTMRPPPPIRRSSSISRQHRHYAQSNISSPSSCTNEADNLPPPPAFLLQPENDGNNAHQTSVAETVKQLTELKHMPASPSVIRRVSASTPLQASPSHSLSTFQQAKNNFSGSNLSLNSTGNLNPIYGQTGVRVMQYMEHSSMLMRKGSIASNSSDISAPSTPGMEHSSFSSFASNRSDDHYGYTGFKLQQEKQYGVVFSPPSDSENQRRTRPHSADRRREQSSLIASLSAKLAPQLSPRTTRRTISSISPADNKGKVSTPSAIQPAFLDKLSATIQLRQRDLARANSVRERINAHAQPDPRVCHTSLMDQIKRGATLRRNKHCNDRSAPKIR